MRANQDLLGRRAAAILCARTILVCLLPGAIVAGCGGSSSVRSPFEAGAQSIRIDVLNRNFADATLRVIMAGSRRRLGSVTGHTNTTFRLDWPSSRPQQIEIDLLAGQNCTTREIIVDPGDVIELQIEPDLRSGGACMFRRER